MNMEGVMKIPSISPMKAQSSGPSTEMSSMISRKNPAVHAFQINEDSEEDQSS